MMIRLSIWVRVRVGIGVGVKFGCWAGIMIRFKIKARFWVGESEGEFY